MEATEKLKRTYQKHKTEYKITVKHYLNNTIKGYDLLGNIIHPFYVQVTYKSRNTRFRSKVKPALGDSFCLEEEANMNLNIALTRDKAFITSLVKLIELINTQNPGEKDFLDINSLASYYNDNCFDLISHVDFLLINEILDIVNEESLNEGKSWDYYSSIKPTTYFEFYKEKYPSLNSLKEKYSSNIWFLDLYIEQVKHHENLKHKIYYNYNVDFSTVLHFWTPKIQDFKDNFIQQELYNYFKGSEEIVKIIEDLDKLIRMREDLNPYIVYQDFIK